jgi:1,4-dihydroxy-2-naphthoyl-CoA hydrolase
LSIAYFNKVNRLKIGIFTKKKQMFDKEKVLALCNEWSKNTLMETLEIEYIDAGLHGGASVALAESVGSAASIMFVNPEKQEVRGIEISANHLRSKREGIIFGTARIIHKGRSIHLWEIKIEDEEGKLISLCKLSNMILPRR